MDIGIVGSGPAADAIEAAMADLDARVVETGSDGFGDIGFCFVVGAAGADAFGAAADSDALDRWVAVEIGGIGGHAVDEIDAAVSVYTPTSGCYRCLQRRVDATAEASKAKPSAPTSAVRYAGALAGRRATRILTGEDLGGTVVEVDGPERRFQPVPFCGCSPGRDRMLSLSDRETDLEEALSRAEAAVDERVGIVEQVGEQASFPLPYYMAANAGTEGFSDASAAPFAAGAAADWNEAYMKALGEALERYAAGVYRNAEFRHAPATALDNAVSPDRFVTSDSYDPDPAAERPWVPGLDLESEDGVWLPAEAVQYPPPEQRIKPPITTGLGLGSSTVEATISGLSEVIERDATMLSWYSDYEPLGLSIDDERFTELEKRAASEDLTVTVTLLTQDIDVPVVAATVHRAGGEWPRFAAGSGADLDPVDAATGALAEAIQNWIELRDMGPEQAADEGGAIAEYADFPDRVRELTHPATTIPAESVADDADLSGGEALETLVERVREANLTPYAARTTTRDVATLGFEGVRAVIPKAQPLFTAEPFFGDRLDRVAASMGFEAKPGRAYHPYP
ncbi:YcaO-like family protein [Halolamina salifodinae]|uniref:Ribosomal protein S12 methylthiotransferase accessory factor n=1 Tax=Halolamina salifodinae TaxID=1202767 RepID=A0A8T4H4Q3_9EURY|nr:YcaO-like family protein [Halolamina salifodinae]MBP1988118.1 ribosomal protein S12 methylthiotransferase accessory factor [Halolamina salifodinae]